MIVLLRYLHSLRNCKIFEVFTFQNRKISVVSLADDFINLNFSFRFSKPEQTFQENRISTKKQLKISQFEAYFVGKIFDIR